MTGIVEEIRAQAQELKEKRGKISNQAFHTQCNDLLNSIKLEEDKLNQVATSDIADEWMQKEARNDIQDLTSEVRGLKNTVSEMSKKADLPKGFGSHATQEEELDLTLSTEVHSAFVEAAKELKQELEQGQDQQQAQTQAPASPRFGGSD